MQYRWVTFFADTRRDNCSWKVNSWVNWMSESLFSPNFLTDTLCCAQVPLLTSLPNNNILSAGNACAETKANAS